MILAHKPATTIAEQTTIADSVMHARKIAVEDGMPAKQLEKVKNSHVDVDDGELSGRIGAASCSRVCENWYSRERN